MDRVSSSASSSATWSANRFEEPNFGAVPEEVFQKIVSFVDKADNQTLVSLASASTDCWRLCGVASLRSYLYAARSALTHTATEDKSAILVALIGWLPKVSSQLPVETRNQMWLELIVMTDSAEISPKDRVSISSNILEVVKHLHNEELEIFSSSEASLEDHDSASLYQLSKVVQQAVACYLIAMDKLNMQIRMTQIDMMSRMANFLNG